MIFVSSSFECPKQLSIMMPNAAIIFRYVTKREGDLYFLQVHEKENNLWLIELSNFPTTIIQKNMEDD